LRLADLAGASVDLAGVLDLPLAAWDVSGNMVLARTGPVQRLLGIEAPLALDRFAPLRLTASSRREAGVTNADLTLSGTGVRASVRGRLDGDPGDGTLALTVAADVAETRDFLEALGWPAPPDAPSFGRLSTEVSLSREDGPVLVRIAAAVGGDSLQGEATVATDGARPRIAGSLELVGFDAGLFTAGYHTLAIPLGFPRGDPWLWPGVWPDQPMSWSWLNAADVELKVAARQRSDGAAEISHAGFTVELAKGDLGLREVSLPLAGGVLSGTATLEGRGNSAILGAELRLENARIESLAMSAAAGSAITGELDLHASLLGEGRSIADMVRTLSGEGGLALPRSNLPDLGLDDLSLNGAFTLASGVLAAPLELHYPGGQGSLDFRLDLPAWILSATLELAGVRRDFLGPPGRIAPVATGSSAP
jgi:AsmA protein